jgi:hypothetical protein
MEKEKYKNFQDYSEIQLRDIFSEVGLNPLDIDRAIADYARYRASELSSLSILSYKELQNLGEEALYEAVFKKLRQGGEIVDDILKGYLRYINYKKEMAETYQESKDWGLVFSTSAYSDIKEAQESFIDYVEETYEIKVKDSKHLQKITGITNLYNYWDKDKGFLDDDEADKLAKKQNKPLKSYQATEEQTGAEALRQLEDTITGSRYSKYFRALEKALQEGAKYKDLLQIKPKEYRLPQTWGGCLGSDQYNSILWAISFEYLINEPASLMLLPDLRSIAQEVEAPYSVLMDCYNLTAKG